MRSQPRARSPGTRPAAPLDAGLEPAWLTGDEVYGRSSELREAFEQRGIGYVFAIGRVFKAGVLGDVAGHGPVAVARRRMRISEVTCR